MNTAMPTESHESLIRTSRSIDAGNETSLVEIAETGRMQMEQAIQTIDAEGKGRLIQHETPPPCFLRRNHYDAYQAAARAKRAFLSMSQEQMQNICLVKKFSSLLHCAS